MGVDSKCGICGMNPKWLQRFATTRSFLVVYGLLGTVQSMAFVYIGVSLTTLEKRFKIPSRITGILLSGNEISQILSVVLMYYGGSGHRPRWIAYGVAASALSCFVLALPHFMYGPGEEALALTHEYANTTILTADVSKNKELPTCFAFNRTENCDEDHLPNTNIVPKILVFLSQFILGIGTTLYYGLGQTYMDDNTKKKNTPMLLGITFSLRMIGPLIGFVLSYYCLRVYIDPTLHPIIDDQDPRWLGAWWLGWIILGLMQGFFVIFLGMFPKELRKSKSKKKKVPSNESEVPLNSEQSNQESQSPVEEEPSLKDFVVSFKRIMKNKLFMCNTFGAVFYILGSAPFIYFMGKYMEVQYGTSAGGGTIIAGPLKITGIVFGFLISGMIIGKCKPSARPLLAWNVFSGVLFVLSKVISLYITCETGSIQGVNLETMKLNLTNSCNVACHCEQVKFSPVCHEPTGITYFSACHAGCQKTINDTTFGDCKCVTNLDYRIKDAILETTSLRIEDQFSKTFSTDRNFVTVGPCKTNCFKPYMIFTLVSAVVLILGISGRVGSVIVNYRCVEPRDKSLSQGVALMVVSLFATIPAPIVAGALMDSTCLIWDLSCKSKGNCWVYHKDKFNKVVNISGAAFIFIGVLADALSCYYAKGIDLYGEEEEAEKRNAQLKNNDTAQNEVSGPKS